jgi:hypothetical protein
MGAWCFDSMPSIEQRIIPAILTMIRARQKAPSASEGLRARSGGAVAPATLREALLSDFTAVAALKQRWGLNEDSLPNWERLWHRNPALLRDESERPIGWVLEAEGAIVGYLGNIPLLYRYGHRTLTAVSSHGLVVEPSYRNVAVSLVAAFYDQRSVDLYLVTTAIPEVGRLARAFKSDALPQQDYDTVLFWVLRPYSFAQVVMEKLRLKSALGHFGAMAASIAVGIDTLFRRRWPRERLTRLAVSEISINEIGDDFESLWREKLTEPPRLIADRSPATLRWHFEVPGDRGSARVFCCRRDGELLGYAVVRNDPQPDGLQKSIVADMLAKKDDPEVIRALLMAAYDHAKKSGSYVLEVVGYPPSFRRVFLEGNPYLRKYPASPFYYKAADSMLHQTLSDGMAWYASPFDGDTSLIRPSFSATYQPKYSQNGVHRLQEEVKGA